MDAHSSDFWVLVAALKEFLASEGATPLEGSLPDMLSTTDSYVELQRVYREKAIRDANLLGERAAAILKRTGRGDHTIDSQKVRDKKR